MKFRHLFLITIILSAIFCGCSAKGSKDILAKDLIISDLDKIDMLQISNSEGSTKQIADKSVITEVYKNLRDIKMKKLSVDEEGSMMKSIEITHSVIFLSEKSIVGSVIIASSGDILIPRASKEVGKQRTESYLNKIQDNQKLKDLLLTLEKSK